MKFKNGNVKKILNYDEAKLAYDEIEEIIYLGDILFPLGDVMNRNSLLIKPGYVEEWWNLELEKAGGKVEDFYQVTLEMAISLSKTYSLPLHPKYIFYWTQISYDQFLGFIDWLQHARIHEKKLLFPYNSSERERFHVGKRALELLGVEHIVGIEHVIVEEKITQALLVNLGLDMFHDGAIHLDHSFKKPEESDTGEVLTTVNSLSAFIIKDKAGEFIGTRMGRPEKAKLRKLTGSPNILFPVGEEGGRMRSITEAMKQGSIR